MTSAESVINDTFRFSDGASGTAYLDWSIDGTASAAEGLDLSFGVGVLLFYWVPPGAGVAEELIYAYTSSGFICDALLVETTCSVGSSFAAQGSIPLPITSGDYFLQTALQSQARDGTSNFGNTARLYLRTPDGVTIDSASGRFLASATPISAVPESSANALLLAGLGVLGFVARRRRLL